jgi:hypothetical protein
MKKKGRRKKNECEMEERKESLGREESIGAYNMRRAMRSLDVGLG